MFTVVLLVFARIVAGHNWINSISRSATAAATVPVVPSSTGKPHATVAPGQKFQIEYMTGHGDYTYLFVQSYKDRGKLAFNTKKHAVKILLDNPPAGQDVPLRNEYKKHHRKMKADLHAKNGENFFASLTRHGEPGYITREIVFEGELKDANQEGHRANEAKFTEETVKSIIQAEYKEEHLANDRRFTFYDQRHPELPWLLEFRQYQMLPGNPLEMDVVLFEFPEGTPLGDYMIYYNFNGYYDAIDVRVVAEPPALVYGPPPPAEKKYEQPDYVRVDHCAFNVEQVVGACIVIVADMDSCLRQCSEHFYSRCTGVQVIPVKNPSHALDYSLYNEFLAETDESNGNNCPRTLLEEANEGDFICVPVFAKLPTQTEQRFRTTNDPIAPEYYSTCHIRQRVLDEPPSPKPEISRQWRKAQRECVSCKAAAAQQRHEQMWVDWQLNPPAHCINCDLEPIDHRSLPPVKNYSALIDPFVNVKLDSRWLKQENGLQVKDCGFPNLDGGYDCKKRFDGFCNLRCHVYYMGPPMGKSAQVSPLDCAIAVHKEKFCSNKNVQYTYRKTNQQRCQCWAASPTVPPALGCCPAEPEIQIGGTHKATMVADIRPDFADMIPTGPLGGNDALL